jgi:hypothetical protein
MRPSLNRLHTQHRLIAELHALGQFPPAQIAPIVGYTPQYVAALLRTDPLLQDYMDTLTIARDQDLQQLFGQTVRTLADALSPDQPMSVRLKAATLWFRTAPVKNL